VTSPYNLYFTPDGSTAVVVAQDEQRLDLYDPSTWQLRASVPVAHAGVSHGDFSEDGRYFYASCALSGWLVKVDLAEARLVEESRIGALPADVRLSPDASVLYVADEGRHGLVLADPDDLEEVGFVPTGRGAHGLVLSRDTTRLYVANRLEGSVAVVDLAEGEVVATWRVPGGGSPDSGGVSVDGRHLWLSGRYHGEVYVFDTTDGRLVDRLRLGAGPHGLAVFPQPGRFSLGHTGVYR
jgi:6-phosphogluconolactonase (cycloisomerase 2 family)